MLNLKDTKTPEIPAYKRSGLTITSASGVEVQGIDGRTYLDFYGAHATCSLGHGHPKIVESLQRQSEQLFFQTNLVDVPVRQDACSKLAAFAPTGLDHVFLVNSGAEAVENALKLAFRKTKKTRVLALEGAFHGRTPGAATVTWGSSSWYSLPSTPFDVTFVAPEDFEALESSEGHDLAAIIFEAVQGVAGASDLSHEFIQALEKKAHDHGALLIADEVQCGMGRSGAPFAFEHAHVSPDIVVTAKGLGGGFPCSAVICKEPVAATIAPGDLGTTFGGGPLASAMIATVIDTLQCEDILENVVQREQQIRESCVVGPVESIQGKGLLLGLRVSSTAKEVVECLRSRGIIVGGSADPKVVRLMPPLTLTSQHVEALRHALQEIAR